MPFVVKWTLKGDKAQIETRTAKEAVEKAQEVMGDGAEDITITNPKGECFEIDYFSLISKLGGDQ
jgi:hypothetical protein